MGAAKVAHHAAVVHDTAVHMQAKANAAMYKAHVPHVYTHQAPYVYNYNPVVYKAPEVKAPAVTYAAPVTYTHQTPYVYNYNPVAYTTHHQSMVYNAPAYVPTFHSLHKREAEAEAEADPQVFYNTYGYYPQGYTPVTYTKTVNPVVYKSPVPVTYTHHQVATPVTYTTTPYTHQSMVYNAYPYAPQFNTLFKREIEAEPY